jgi:fructokinase
MDDNNNAEYQFHKASLLPSLRFPELVDNDLISFGSTMAVHNEGRNELLQFLKTADKKALTIYDPNIRETDKKELTGIRQKVEENLHLTKVLKGSEQDFCRLYETSDATTIFSKMNTYGIKALIITAGEKPVQLITSNFSKEYHFEAVKPVSTIGAGDNFTAGIIAGFYKYQVNIENINSLPEQCWDHIINLGNSFAAEVCKCEFNYISPQFASGLINSF